MVEAGSRSWAAAAWRSKLISVPHGSAANARLPFGTMPRTRTLSEFANAILSGRLVGETLRAESGQVNERGHVGGRRRTLRDLSATLSIDKAPGSKIRLSLAKLLS